MKQNAIPIPEGEVRDAQNEDDTNMFSFNHNHVDRYRQPSFSNASRSTLVINPNSKDADYRVKHPTGDPKRDKARKLIADALMTEDEYKSYLPGGLDDVEAVSNGIENHMYNHFDGNTNEKYKSKFRDLRFNLTDKKNSNLRKQVLSRYISPAKLVSMPSQELANEEIKKIRLSVKRIMTMNAQTYNKTAAPTDQFKCRNCSQRETT